MFPIRSPGILRYPPGTSPELLEKLTPPTGKTVGKEDIINVPKVGGFQSQPESLLPPGMDQGRQLLPPKLDVSISGIQIPKLDSRLKVGTIQKAQTGLILDPKVGTRVITPQIVKPVTVPKLSTSLKQDQPTVQKFVATFAPPPKLTRGTARTFGLPPAFLPPYFPPSLKKPPKKKKPKKSKKKKLAWAVPDVWYGYYDPREYKVIKGKGDKLPDWLSGGLD